MNSVHEPGSNGDSETLPSQKTRSKTKPGARAPNWPSLCAQAARAWPCRGHCGHVVAVAPGRVARRDGRVVAECCARQRCVAARKRASLRCVARHSPASQAPYVTIQNLALQYNSLPVSLAAYISFPSCNILSVLQYTTNLLHTYCNTNLCVLQYYPAHQASISAIRLDSIAIQTNQLQYTSTSFITSKSQYNHPLAIQFSFFII